MLANASCRWVCSTILAIFSTGLAARRRVAPFLLPGELVTHRFLPFAGQEIQERRHHTSPCCWLDNRSSSTGSPEQRWGTASGEILPQNGYPVIDQAEALMQQLKSDKGSLAAGLGDALADTHG